MTAAPPTIPPRPSRSVEKDQSLPQLPPRPINRQLDRSVSPSNPERFAPSPLNDSPFNRSPKATRFSQLHAPVEPVDRIGSVTMPSVGEEGQEYEAVNEERSSSPEQTRTVGEDLKLHAPKPSLPKQNATQRIAAVTRTDSDRAAQFGIGRPSLDEHTPSNRSLKKKASTASQLSGYESQGHLDDEHGIPEIGQRVPMYPNAGDVQAPSPAPPTVPATEGPRASSRHHHRKTSSRGQSEQPPGSYGLHGHGVLSTDKLEKDYYQKHPELLRKEQFHYQPDRANDFSMSGDQLNNIVRKTASTGTPLGTGDHAGTPSEEIGYQASEEYASRINSPRPPSTAPKPESTVASPLKQSFSPGIQVTGVDDVNTVHIDEPNHRRSIVSFVEHDAVATGEDEGDSRYSAPILAEDEVAKDPSPYEMHPAVELAPERRGSAYDTEESLSRPTSRPQSTISPVEIQSTPLEDVEEYEPLFSDEGKEIKKPLTTADKLKMKRRFPSADIWEDAPDSVHFTASVSTPEPSEERFKSAAAPHRDGETPAQAFARHQEELAEKEAQHPEAFLTRQQKPIWAKKAPGLAQETRPSLAQRFPSRDIWEDAPESHQLHAELTHSEEDPASSKPEAVQSSGNKPVIPDRPKSKQTPSDDKLTSKPTIPDRPKPQVPARPPKPPSAETKEVEGPPPKQKPVIPARPMGGKIAALQAGFMSDLNKRLQLGPNGAKKEEPPAVEVSEETKAPLSDARKGRARGPQRRAPRVSLSPATPFESIKKPSFGFSSITTVFSIDPRHDTGELSVEQRRGPVGQADDPKVRSNEMPSAASQKAPRQAEDESGAEPATDVKANLTEKHHTLATNTAGEALLGETIEKDTDHVEPINVEEAANN